MQFSFVYGYEDPFFYICIASQLVSEGSSITVLQWNAFMNRYCSFWLIAWPKSVTGYPKTATSDGFLIDFFLIPETKMEPQGEKKATLNKAKHLPLHLLKKIEWELSELSEFYTTRASNFLEEITIALVIVIHIRGMFLSYFKVQIGEKENLESSPAE